MPKAKKQSLEVKRRKQKEKMAKQRKTEEGLKKSRAANKKSQKNRNDEKKAASNLSNKKSQKKRLSDPEKAELHRQRLKKCQSERLADPEMAELHRERLRKSQSQRLADPEMAELHRERARKCQSERLADPEMAEQHRERARKCQSERLADPEMAELHRERLRKSQSERLADPDMAELHRERLRKSQSERLADPKMAELHRERARKSQSQRLADPAKAEEHRARSRKSNKERLADPDKRKKHNEQQKREYHEKASKKIDKIIGKYKIAIKDGPFWECVSCRRLWFRSSVNFFTANNFDPSLLQLVHECCPDKLDDMNIGYICTTCSKNLKSGTVPKLSMFHKELHFPEMPDEIKILTHLEERFLSPRIPFMRISMTIGHQQYIVKGRVVNVPTEVGNSIKCLPRKFKETDIIPVALKKKVKDVHAYILENVRPSVIHAALRVLKNSPVYKAASIEVDETRPVSPIIFNNVPENVEETIHPNVDEKEEEEEEEEEEKLGDNIPDDETLLMSNTIVFAPGEGFRPLPLFLDEMSEWMSFIKIYCGELRTIPNNMSYQEYVKSEIMRSDRRCANVVKLFYSSLKLRLQKISSSIGFCMRKTKGAPINVTAAQALSDDFLNSTSKLDSGYRMFTPDRGSPSFWEAKKKEVFAMISMLGPPTFFITLSPAETKWPELLVILKKVVDKISISEEEAMDLSDKEKTRLIKEDPVTCARYFDYRIRTLLKLIKNQNFIFKNYTIADSYFRVEFQQRGSPHVHGLLWLENAPTFKTDEDNTACEEFIDQFITCDSDQIPEDLLNFQLHRHSFTCGKTRTKPCRFGIPYFPMDRTRILEPFDDTTRKMKEKLYKSKLEKIKEFKLKIIKEKLNISFEDFLDALKLTFDEYIEITRSTLKKTKVFLRRKPNEIMINGFNKDILELHRSNMDIQFITDIWSCAMYVLNYINKSKRGLSRLMREAIKETRLGNQSIKEQLRFLANKFLNSSEMTAQEAVYYILSLPLSKCSRTSIFINTGRPENRVSILKSKDDLKKLDRNSVDIFQKNILQHYCNRPDSLEILSLAEFAGFYNYSKTARRRNNFGSDIESDEETDSALQKSIPLKNNDGFVNKRKKSKIIRYTKFNRLQDEENYYREQVMLFYPWRDEIKELLNVDCKKKFVVNNAQIMRVRSNFVFNNQHLDDILDEIIRENPNINENEDSETEEAKDYSVLNDRTEEGDIFEDIGINGKERKENGTTIPTPFLMNDDAYFDLVRSLNEKQRMYLLHILNRIKTEKEPFFECVLGGAGVGKSRLIEAIQQTVLRYLNKKVDDDLRNVKVLLVAPTGKAAFAINGSTLHSAFALPLNQCREENTLLNSSSMNSLISTFYKLKLIIMDEVSMIGSKMLAKVDMRLKQIFRSTSPFGGISVLMFGDFNQLAPVGDSYVFTPDKSNPYSDLIGNPLWDMFSFFELTEIMRQKDDLAFANALNALAIGEMSQQQIELFEKREIGRNGVVEPSETLRLFRTNESVDSFNNSVLEKISGVLDCEAEDKVENDVPKKTKDNLIESVRNRELHKNFGLPTSLKLAKEINYMLTNNVEVKDGLVNGAVGKAKFIETGSNNEVIRVWIHFKPERVGQELRAKSFHLALKHGLERKPWTPISKISRQIRPWDKLSTPVTRKQFPLVPAEAITIYKSQGGTYDSVVVSLEKPLRRTELYVACSRATKLSGLYFIGKFKAPVRPSEDDKVKSAIADAFEKKSVNFRIPFLKDFEQRSVIFHNVQSLNAHYLDIVADFNFERSSVIILTETWSKKSEKYEIKDHELIHRIDCSDKRHAYGLFVYCSKSSLLETEIIADANCESNGNKFNLVLLRHGNIHICAGYRSPSSSFKNVENIINNWLSEIKSKFIVIGDFNVDISENDNLSKLMRKFGLENKLFGKKSTDGDTQIDVMFSNESRVLANYNESYFSYHKPIICLLERDDNDSVHFDNETQKRNDRKTKKRNSPIRSTGSKKFRPSEGASEEDVVKRMNEKISEFKFSKSPLFRVNSYQIYNNDLSSLKTICTEKDFETFKKHKIDFMAGWLTDNIIDGFLSCLESKFKNFGFFDTTVGQFVMFGQYEAVQLVNKGLISDKTRFALPILLNGNHWVVALLKMKEKTFSIVDSMNERIEADVINHVKMTAERIAENQPNGSAVEFIFEKNGKKTVQKDNFNCGVFVCWYAWRFASDQELWTENFNPNLFRAQIFDEIMLQKTDIPAEK